MKKVKQLLLLSVFFTTASYAGVVVRDTLGTISSSAKNVETLLQGQVAGVRVWSQDGSPMSASGVSIRGINSLRGGVLPLYVVDGTVLNESSMKNIDPLWQYPDQAYASSISPLAFLSPNDIESIEVLKNTSATALYGSKGANGVVIIKTKKIGGEQPGIFWDSGLDVVAPKTGAGTHTGVSHNHKVMFAGTGKGSAYTLSGYFRDDNHVIPTTGATKGGLRASFEIKANPVVQFGLNSQVGVASVRSASAGAWYGRGSYTLNMRDPQMSVDGWAADYDDDALEFRALNSMWLKLNIARNFSFKFDLGTDIMSHQRRFWWGLGTPFGKEKNGAAANLKTAVFAYNASASFDYSCYVARDHKITAALGAQALGGKEMLNTMNGVDFYDHGLRANALNLAAGRSDVHKFTTDEFALGIYARLAYSWKDIVGADIAYRTDYTPEFDMWKSYPSASAFWDIRRTFFHASSILSSLRLDGGYGESGKQAYIPYLLFGRYTPGTYEDVDHKAAAFFDGQTYQHTREWNISLAAGFFRDRLSLEAGYYRRNTSDCLTLYSKGEKIYHFWQYADRKVLSSQESVIANSGVEFSVTGVPVKTRDWTLSVSLNGAYNTNELTSVSLEDAGGKSLGQGLVATGNIQGGPVSAIVGSDGAVLGNPIPKFHGGVGAVLRWKDLHLDILADGSAGFDILNMNAMARDKATSVSSESVEDGSFLRLARVSLSYDVPVSAIEWIKSVRVFAAASDLAVATGYSGFSPDVNSFAASGFRLGADYGSYPAARSFVLGFSIRF